MKLRLFCFYAIFVVVASCKSDSEEKLVDAKDIVPQSEKYGDNSDLKNQKPDSVDNSFNLDLAKEIGLPCATFRRLDEPFFLDRFTPKSIFKWELNLATAKTFVGQWSFKDSIATMNALYNWLDCFGAKCKSHKFLDKVNFQTNNFVVFLNDTSIAYVTSEQQLDKELWRSYFEKQNGIKEWDLVMYQARRGKVNWMTYKESNKKEKFEFQTIETNK